MEFLQLSETTRAREIDAELKKNKWRNEWLDPTRAWVAPGPLLDIFLFFSKTKNFHSHPCSVVHDAFVCAPSMKCLFFGYLTSQQHASVSQGRICSDNFTCCHTEIEVADKTFHLTQSQNTDTGPTSPSADPITPVAWQGSHWSANI